MSNTTYGIETLFGYVENTCSIYDHLPCFTQLGSGQIERLALPGLAINHQIFYWGLSLIDSQCHQPQSKMPSTSIPDVINLNPRYLQSQSWMSLASTLSIINLTCWPLFIINLGVRYIEVDCCQDTDVNVRQPMDVNVSWSMDVNAWSLISLNLSHGCQCLVIDITKPQSWMSMPGH